MFAALFRSKHFLWLVLTVPLVVIGVRYVAGGLFYGEVIHVSGEFSVRLMMIAMAATPLALAFPGRGLSRWLMQNRRYFGVASFAYGVLHTAVYWHKTMLPADILADAVLPEYLTGWIALFVFAALAATSNDAAVRWLRRAWKTLHRLIYPAAILIFVHWILVAFNPIPAAMHLAVLASMEGYRIWKLWRIRSAAA